MDYFLFISEERENRYLPKKKRKRKIDHKILYDVYFSLKKKSVFKIRNDVVLTYGTQNLERRSFWLAAGLK